MTIRSRLGAGNFSPGTTNLDAQYTVLAQLGLSRCRINTSNFRDKNGVPTPQAIDSAVAQASSLGISPIILFEYYGNFKNYNPPILIGTNAQWFTIGAAFATRFPNVTMFQAFNEPDIDATIDKTQYHDALAGLADGVHSVNAQAKVYPGGFGSASSYMSDTLNGYGPVISDLLNSGKLAGLDLHTYYSHWFQIKSGNMFSAQGCFSRVKAACGITRDIEFISTEFNISSDDAGTKLTLDDLGKGFLTGLWDHLGVVRAGGVSATTLCFPWNLFDTPQVNVDDADKFGMAQQLLPYYIPDVRGRTLKIVLDLCGEMEFTALDPTNGKFILSDGLSKTLYVWQNRKDWTLTPSSTFTVPNLIGISSVDVYNYSGLRSSNIIVGTGPYTVSGLPGNETYMILVTSRPNAQFSMSATL